MNTHIALFLCSLSRESQDLAHLKTCLSPVAIKTSLKQSWIEIELVETQSCFIFPTVADVPCVFFFSWEALAFPSWSQSCHREGVRGRDRQSLPRTALSPADPTRIYVRAAHSLHSGRFVSFLARFYLPPADQEREEEGITSDGWSGELMKGRLQGFANGAAGRKICGWISTSRGSLLWKWPKLPILVITADGVILDRKSVV